ncbi:MAG: hypothetical protein VW298_01545, partial [Candidatus Woesearchaeota archaeon]
YLKIYNHMADGNYLNEEIRKIDDELEILLNNLKKLDVTHPSYSIRRADINSKFEKLLGKPETKNGIYTFPRIELLKNMIGSLKEGDTKLELHQRIVNIDYGILPKARAFKFIYQKKYGRLKYHIENLIKKIEELLNKLNEHENYSELKEEFNLTFGNTEGKSHIAEFKKINNTKSYTEV